MKQGYKQYQFGIAPLDWDIKQIGDIFDDLRTGSTPSRTRDDYYTGSIPWITSGELKYKVIYETLENITQEAVKDTNLMTYPIGTFFIAITGLEAAGTRGSCAITGVEATTNQSCLAFIPRKGFSNKYLYYWYLLHGEHIGLKYTQGTKQQSLNNKIVQGFEIPIPPLPEQQKIADILSTVDEQIDNVDQLIEKTRELKKGLMQQLLTKGIGHTEFKETEVGMIPKEWEVKKLWDITRDMYQGINTVTEKVEYRDNGYSILQAKHITKERIDFEDVRFLGKADYDKYNNKYNPMVNDILVSNIGTIGKVVVVDMPIEFLIAWNIFLIKPKCEVNSYYLGYYLRRLSSINYYDKYITGNATKFINKSCMEEIAIPIPSNTEQDEIANILIETDKKIDQYKIRQNKLQELKKGLMQQLLTGKIRVTTDK